MYAPYPVWSLHIDALSCRTHLRSHLSGGIQHRPELLPRGALQKHAPSGAQAAKQVGSGNNPVGGHSESRPVQRPASADQKPPGSDTLNIRAAVLEVTAKRRYLRLKRRSRKDGIPLRHDACKYHIFRGAHAGNGKLNLRAVKVLCLGLQLAPFFGKFHAHFLKRRQMQVYGTRSDDAASRILHHHLAAPSDKRPEKTQGRPHSRHRLLRHFSPSYLCRVHRDSLFMPMHRTAHASKQTYHGMDIGDPWTVFNKRALPHQKRRRQNRQRGIFRALYTNFSLQGNPALNTNRIHCTPSGFRLKTYSILCGKRAYVPCTKTAPYSSFS